MEANANLGPYALRNMSARNESQDSWSFGVPSQNLKRPVSFRSTHFSSDTSYERVSGKDNTSVRTHQTEVRPVEDDDIPLVSNSGPVLLPRTSTQSVSTVLLWWLPELLATALSISTFVAIVVVLRAYNGRSLTDLNLPRFLTLNGMIAALATLNRAFMVAPVASAITQELWLFYAAEARKASCSSRLEEMNRYDSASRSAWGSLTFLIYARGRRFVASLGCFVTIASLAFGAFSQQLVAFDRPVATYDNPLSTPSNLPRSETWIEWLGNPAEGDDAWGPPLNMIAAVYSGVLTESVTALPAHCPTGNCTWPLTPSLAVCGGCVPSSYQTIHCPSHCNETRSDSCFCTYKLPSGSQATLWNFRAERGGDNVLGFQSIPSDTGAHFNRGKDDRLYVANLDLFGAPYLSYSVEDPVISATECALWMCVNVYNTTVSSTYQQQDVAATFDKLNATEGSTTYDAYKFPPIPAIFDPGHTTTFNVSTLAVEALQSYMTRAMNGSVVLNLESQTYSSDLVQGIWNGTTNPQAWIENVAGSMSNIVRSTNTTSRPQYNRTTYQLGVNVRWVWLALPASLVLLSTIVLVLVMQRTANSPVEAWKGSPLTLLLFDVDKDTRDAAIGRAREYRGIERAVGWRKVRLGEETERTWKFKAC